jgi:DNA gyrase subunit B
VDADEPGRWFLEVTRAHHGVESTWVLQKEFFESPEYRRIAELGAELTDLIGAGAFVVRGEKRKAIGSFQEAVDWLMGEARRGQSVQRYKGLGEMNPDQLWETTVNPESRRLMQVRIEDAVASDEIFTTLMGDHVEPRREFIERNALAATNLDV